MKWYKKSQNAKKSEFCTWFAKEMLKITDNYTMTDDERYRDYLVDTTIKKFIVITLPLLINNQNKSVFRINHTGNGIIRIQGQGSDTINNYLTEIEADNGTIQTTWNATIDAVSALFMSTQSINNFDISFIICYSI